MQAIQSDAGREVVSAVFNFVNYHQFRSVVTRSDLSLVGFEALEQTNFALLVTVGSDPRSDAVDTARQRRPGRTVRRTDT